MSDANTLKRTAKRTGLDYKKAREFVNLYRGDSEARGNATACYRKMYPKAKAASAQAQASKYLNDPMVQEMLEDHAMRMTVRADVTQEMVLDELRKMAFFDIRRLYHDDGSPKGISELDDDTAAAIIGLDAVNIGNSEAGMGQVLKYKLADKKGALELFGKHLKMWTEKVEATVTGQKSLAELAKEARDDSE